MGGRGGSEIWRVPGDSAERGDCSGAFCVLIGLTGVFLSVLLAYSVYTHGYTTQVMWCPQHNPCNAHKTHADTTHVVHNTTRVMPQHAPCNATTRPMSPPPQNPCPLLRPPTTSAQHNLEIYFGIQGVWGCFGEFALYSAERRRMKRNALRNNDVKKGS